MDIMAVTAIVPCLGQVRLGYPVYNADHWSPLQAEVAAEFINRRVPGTRVVPHVCMIQDYDESFYKQFHVIVCGLVKTCRQWPVIN